MNIRFIELYVAHHFLELLARHVGQNITKITTLPKNRQVKNACHPVKGRCSTSEQQQ